MNPMPVASLPRIAQVPEPRLAILDDASFIVGRIAAITGIDEKAVCRRLREEMHSVGINVQRAMAEQALPLSEWSDAMSAFYAQTDAFLYESVVWNQFEMKLGVRRWIAEFLQRKHPQGARMLCYGDGLGLDSAYFAGSGHEVTYYEVSQRCRAFAASVFERTGARATPCDSLEALASESLDAVVCLDVLEHVPDPPSLVRSLAELLRPGGHFIVHAPFFYVCETVPSHLRTNLTYSGDWRRLYAPFGLYPVEARSAWVPLALEKVALGERPRHPVPWHVRIQGWSLRMASLWNWPHLFITRRMVTRGRMELRRRSEQVAFGAAP